VKAKAKHLQGRPRVYVEEWHQPPMASGNWVPEIVRAAGGEPFPILPGALSREVTLDEVARFGPALIVISWCGAGSLADKNLLLQRGGWDALSAVQQGSVRVIDDSLLNRPGPRLVEGAQRLYGWLAERAFS
jgi:iron complex transport system substrate-binding protein